MKLIESLGTRKSKIAPGVLLQVCLKSATKYAVVLLLPTLLASYPAASKTPDQNHVDMTSGAISLSFEELSIGSGAYGLTLVSVCDLGSEWRANLAGVLQVRTFGERNGDVEITASRSNPAWTFNDVEGYSRGGDGAYIASLRVGAHTIIASYPGRGTNAPNTTTLSVNVPSQSARK